MTSCAFWGISRDVAAFRQIFAILRKDLLLELRSKEVLTTMLVFALVVVVLFNFVFDPGAEEVKVTAPGILWVAIVFAGNLGLSRTFAREQENGVIQGLLLCPIDRSYLFVAKVLGNIIFIFLLEVVILPVMIVLFDVHVGGAWPMLLLVLLLGIIGFASVGTVFSAISANTKSREVMLPILEKLEQETGIRVRPVYDVEAAKTTGLVNRLMAEKAPFWPKFEPGEMGNLVAYLRSLARPSGVSKSPE